MMKAIAQDRYGSVDVLKLQELNLPVPKKGSVLLKVHAAGVDPGVWHLMTGKPYIARLFIGLRKPRIKILGMDVAGVVVSVGEGVTGLKPGDEVFGTARGSFAEFVLATPEKLALKPAGLTFEQAAVVPVSGCTALQALRDRAKVTSGQRVLVIGAGGGVGTYAIQLAKHFGCTVTAVCSARKAQLVKQLGADEVIDYTTSDFTGKYDVIIDIAGGRPLARLRQALSPQGTLVFVGNEKSSNITAGLGRLMVAPMLSKRSGQKLTGFMAASNRTDLNVLTGLLSQGVIAPALDRSFPLSQAGEAISYVQSGQSLGKVALTVD